MILHHMLYIRRPHNAALKLFTYMKLYLNETTRCNIDSTINHGIYFNCNMHFNSVICVYTSYTYKACSPCGLSSPSDDISSGHHNMKRE